MYPLATTAWYFFTLGRKQNKTRFNWDTWKFNDKLLQDEEFVNGVKERIGRLIEAGSRSIGSRWDRFKEEVKSSAIERSCILKSRERQKEKDLQCQLHFLLAIESAQPGKYTKEIREVKSQLELIDIDNYRGAVIRARANKLWAGETPTKRSLSDEKRYAARNEVSAIQYGKEVTREGNIIERAFTEYYRGLLGRKISVEEGFKAEFLTLMPKLDDEVKASLEVPISLQEIKRAFDDLSSGKSPGPDGLGAAFYKAFKDGMAEALHR